MRAGWNIEGSWKRIVACGLLWASTLLLAACNTVQHGYHIDEVVGRSLATATPEGKARLALETEYDSAVRKIVARKGQPEWLHIVSRDEIYLYFTSRDEVVVITRPMVPPGEVRIYERTPGFLLKLLPRSTVDAVVASRKPASGRSRTRAKASSTRGRAPPPAAIDRNRNDHSVTFQNFDPHRIVARLRTPLSAADPGVSQWHAERLSNGKSARMATVGTTRYVVGHESVSVSAPIAPRRREAPSRTSQAIYRVNQAVFGSAADEASRRIAPLISRVAADTSGRTRIRRRVVGRTISVMRDTQRGLLIYSVFSR